MLLNEHAATATSENGSKCVAGGAPPLRRKARLNGIAAIVIALLAVVIVIIWIATAQRVAFERTETVDYATRQNSNLVRAFEEHAIRTFTGVDQTLLFIKREYERNSRLDLKRMVKNREVDSSIFTYIGIVDEHGDMVRGSGDFNSTNLADREYFRAQQGADAPGMFIGWPLLGRITRRWAFQASRRIDKPDGSFGGIVYVSIDPGYFTSFYEKVDIGSKGLVLLAGQDGVTRANRIDGVNDFGRDLGRTTLFEKQMASAEGSFLSVGRTTGVPRFTSFRRMSRYPMIVVVATSEQETLAAFNVRKGEYYLAATLISLLVAMLGGAILQSLSRQQRAGAALAASEVRYRATFDHTGVGIAHSTPDGRFLWVNSRLCEMLGYAEQDLVGHEFAEFTYPEDRVHQIRQRLLSRPDGVITDLEKRFVRKDGRVIWAVINAVLIRRPDGTPDYLVGIIQDITGRKKAQQRTQANFNQAAVGVAHSSPELRLLEVNTRFCQMVGYSAEELRGRTFIDLTHPNDVAKAWEFRERLLLDPRSFCAEMEKRYLRKDGSVIWVSIAAAVIRDADGEPDYFFSVIADITERKRAEEALRKSEARLRQSLLEREHLSRDLHDGIVQSIYAVGLGLEHAKKLLRKEPEETGKRLSSAIADLNRVIRRVRKHISGAAPQWMHGERVSAELQSIVESAGAKMQFRLELDPDAVARLPDEAGDEVVYIVREAVSNSLRHSSGRNGTVSLSCTGNGSRLEIADDGAGFDPGQERGAGRGLRNIASRARDLSAELDVRSIPGAGTRIVLDIPALEQSHVGA